MTKVGSGTGTAFLRTAETAERDLEDGHEVASRFSVLMIHRHGAGLAFFRRQRETRDGARRWHRDDGSRTS